MFNLKSQVFLGRGDLNTAYTDLRDDCNGETVGSEYEELQMTRTGMRMMKDEKCNIYMSYLHA